MKKLNLAIIGQGRSGKDIHGAYYVADYNDRFNVKYVVDFDEYRRNVSKERYPGCEVFSDYKELFNKKDIDVVINVTFSEMHFAITKDLLEHGFNVMSDKPFARNRYEADLLIKTAKDNGVKLMAFQQTFYAPIYLLTKEIMQSGKLGKIEQISIRYNNLSRRWDWQTLQSRMAGNVYNTGPHPIGMGLGFVDFDKNAKVAYSKLANTYLFAGDSDSYAKIIIDTPNKPVVDIEINNTDAYSPYLIKVQGGKGTYTCTGKGYKMKYVVDGENVERKPIYEFLEDENKNPMYCSEKLITHEEEADFNGDPFFLGTQKIYEDLYDYIVDGKEPMITAENASQIASIIEIVHAQNPLEIKF